MKQNRWACAHFPTEDLSLADPLVYEYHTYCFDHQPFLLQTWSITIRDCWTILPDCETIDFLFISWESVELHPSSFSEAGLDICFFLCPHWSLPLSGTDVMFLNQSRTSSCRLNRSRETPVSFTLPRPSRTFDYMFEYKRVLRQIIFISYRML